MCIMTTGRSVAIDVRENSGSSHGSDQFLSLFSWGSELLFARHVRGLRLIGVCSSLVVVFPDLAVFGSVRFPFGWCSDSFGDLGQMDQSLHGCLRVNG